jgi:hypothetical protein
LLAEAVAVTLGRGRGGWMLLRIATAAVLALGLGALAAHAMPVDQRAFVDVVEDARYGIRENAPETTLDSMLDRRGYRLCDKIRSAAVVDWLGTVWHIGSTPDGNPTVAVLVGPEIGVTTFTGPKGSSPASVALIEKGSAVAGDIAKLKTSEKVRLSGSLISTRGGRCFTSLAHARDLFAPAFYIQLRSITRTSEGPAFAATTAPGVSPPPSPTLSAEDRLKLCRKDWSRCQDNEELVENYENYRTAQRACRTKADDMAKYGTPDWGGWLKDVFGAYRKGSNYVTTGVAELVETDAKFSNAFGAMVRSRVTCLYDLKGAKVIHVAIDPR